MVSKENGFLKRLQATFKIEAEEHIKNISASLVSLESETSSEKQAQLTEVIFREAHSLKGAARSVNVTDIETICQSLESLFASMKSKKLAPSPGLLDSLHRVTDNLRQLLASLDKEFPTREKGLVKATLQLLDSVSKPEAVKAQSESVPPAPEVKPFETQVAAAPAPSETVRIPAARLESLLLQVEELLSAKLAMQELNTELRGCSTDLTEWEREYNKVTQDIRSLRKQLNQEGEASAVSPAVHVLEFLDWQQQKVRALDERFVRLNQMAERERHSLTGMVDSLVYDMKQVLMLPFSSLLEIIPRLVRDLAREQGKEVKLVIRGEGIEIDRRILDELKDPLIHLVRNCVDHGIETKPERQKKNKPHSGTITIIITQKDSNTVELAITDDGAGVNVKKVKEAAVKRGVINQAAADKLSEDEALSLIFLSGTSTSPIISDISGRGLGLTIVREKVEKLHGNLTMETVVDSGTTFRLYLPLTIATLHGILIRLDEHNYILPAGNLECVVRVKREEIRTVENRATISLNGKIIALVKLSDILALQPSKGIERPESYVPIAVIDYENKKLALEVDEIINEQEVIVKNLGRQLSRVRNILGASVLANGNVVPILNVADLMKAAVTVSPERVTHPALEPEVRQKSLLVVEDSITARTLLKNILEAAGYHVKTAVDGIDAFTVLQTEGFDLVVSDVDMPRMNGFDLTAKIRTDKRFADIPVVLVTALESREHRERGIDVGANAYIVKSSFDQSNLLEVIQRLI